MPIPEVHNNMASGAFSLLGATISLECTILFLGAALYLDLRKAERRQWLRGHLERILQDDRAPMVIDLPDAA
jgi:hypothetical protein